MRFTKAFDFLIRTNGSPAFYVLKASAAAVMGTIVIILIAANFLSVPESSEPQQSPLAMVMILLVIWPLIATAVIAALLYLTKQIAPTYWHAAAAAALAFALLLSVFLGVAVGTVFVWSFFIYAVTFLAWQSRSEKKAWLMTILVHGTVNLLPVLLN